MEGPVSSYTVDMWVRDVIDESRPGQLVLESSALDRLLPDYLTPWDIDRARRCFVDAAAACSEGEARQYMIGLVIPLADSPDLIAEVPDLDRLDLNEFEPPALYVIDRRRLQMFDPFESYRVPINFDLTVDIGFVKTHYVCYRNERAQREKWDYARAVWHQQYLPSL